MPDGVRTKGDMSLWSISIRKGPVLGRTAREEGAQHGTEIWKWSNAGITIRVSGCWFGTTGLPRWWISICLAAEYRDGCGKWFFFGFIFPAVEMYEMSRSWEIPYDCGRNAKSGNDFGRNRTKKSKYCNVKVAQRFLQSFWQHVTSTFWNYLGNKGTVLWKYPQHKNFVF